MAANLLPERFRLLQVVRRRLAAWGAFWCLAGVAAAAILYTHSYVPYEARLATLQTRERQHALVSRLQAENSAMLAETAELESRQRAIIAIAEQPQAIEVLGVISRYSRQTGGSVYVKQLTLARAADLPTNAADPAGGTMRLTLQGAGLDVVSTMRFIANLRDSGCFDAVEVKSTQTETANNRSVVSYQVECELGRRQTAAAPERIASRVQQEDLRP